MTDGLEGISDPQSGKRCARCDRVYPLSQRLCPDDGDVLSLRDPYHLVGGTLADRYRIDALVGIGGMGAVYCAWHLAIDRRVAVKILQPNVAILDEGMKLLFEREARTIGRLVHENVADVFDAGSTSDGIAYIAMEWLDGGTLEEALAADRAFSLARTSDLLGQIALALAAAHAARIVHRDLKPSNVMLTRSPDGHERVKVVDFGIAKAMADSSITRSGALGTPAYASPEQLRGEAVDTRSDVYSLGVILYRMLTGVLPFDGSSLEDLIALKAQASPIPVRQLRPELPQSLADLLDLMLAGDRDERPDSALDVSVPFAEIVRSLPPEEAREVPSKEPPECEPRDQRSEWLPSAAPAPTTLVLETANPLLSELDFSARFQDWARTHQGGGTLATITAAGGLAAIVLSHLVGADCIRVTLQATSTGVQHGLLFGYVAEPNAGLWYLVGAPIFVVAAAHFLRMAHSSLRELAEGERLVIVASDVASHRSVLGIIADRNRRLFRWLTPAILIVAFTSVYVPEYVGYPRPAFGWVGGLSVQDVEGVSLRDLQARGAVGVVPAVRQLCGNAPDCDVRVTRVEGGHGASDRERWFYPFLVFVIFGLALQVLFATFAGWIVAKIVFLFSVLARALLNRSAPGLKIELDFEDNEMRFGLGALDVVHNMVLIVTLVASVVFLLQRVTNVAKGSSFFTGMTGLPLANQLFTFFVSLTPLILLLVAPMAAFMMLVETEVGRAIESIERERALVRKALSERTPRRQKASIEATEEGLRRRRSLVRQQRPWPRQNPTYRLLLAASVFLLVVLPFVVEYLSASGRYPVLASALTRFSETLCWLL